MRGLLDTSVIVAAEEVETSALPDEVAISAMTLAELHYGVLRARTADQRAARLRRLVLVESEFEPLVIDEDVAREFGTIMAAAREDGVRPGTADVLIAATAAAHDLELYTRDRDLRRLRGVRVVQV
jgi:predicted nucleic acid-binding protein